jgi:hypothetical protein
MPSSEDKMIDFHISRLKDKQVDVLLRTIEELERLGAKASRALPALEQLFKTSPDPNVKAAAKRAGYNIFMKSKEDGEDTV